MKHFSFSLWKQGFAVFAVFVAAGIGFVFGQNGDTAPDVTLFADKTLTRLNTGVTDAQINQIADPILKGVAGDLKAGRHDLQRRYRTYEAYEPVSTLARRLKTSTYSRFENPTGIFFEAGEQAVLAIDGIGDIQVELTMHDFGPNGRGRKYPLKNGYNVIPLRNRGLAYISYYTENFRNAPKLTVHVLNGKVNGVFDSATSKAEDWPAILANTACEVLDIVGKRVHLVYSVNELRQHCPERGLDLINMYDQIIADQHWMMGLEKYRRVPKNRMFGRVIWKGYMHADGTGSAFHHNTLKNLANPDALVKNSWGVAHEFGHVNQTRPGLKWVSTTEVTNNLFSIWTQYRLYPAYINLEDERHNDGDGNRVRGGRFNAYLNYAIVHGEQWLCQKGPDKLKNYENGGDHFVKLCPLWQLQLYCTLAGQGNPDFLPDIFEIVRNTDDKGKTNGDFQLAFMKNVCDVNQQDFTDFFVKIGMLKPIDKELDDYTRGQLTITQKDCDALIAYAKKYRKPASPVVYYISRRSLDAYKNKLPVRGTFGQGIEAKDTQLIVSHEVWKNVTVFEAYRGRELVRITLVGTDFPDNTASRVQYPAGCTRLEAVAWDGTRTLVYGTR